jgi:uncharacterized protein (DUF362 family)
VRAGIREALSARADFPTGERVLLKPNFIKERHLLRDEHRQVITQREVIEPVLDWVIEELLPSELRLADAPEGSADMAAILDRSGVAALSSAHSLELEVEDLRLTRYDPARRQQGNGSRRPGSVELVLWPRGAPILRSRLRHR